MAEDNMSNILNSFKNMIHSDNNPNNIDSSNSSNTNLNITPDMISNLANMLKSNNSNSQNTSDSENSHSSAESNDSDSTNFSFENKTSSNIDFETILKVKSIMETLNKKDDPRSNLLYSLKPYLRENRQKKLDQYVNLLKITQVTNLFKNEKGDEN